VPGPVKTPKHPPQGRGSFCLLKREINLWLHVALLDCLFWQRGGLVSNLPSPAGRTTATGRVVLNETRTAYGGWRALEPSKWLEMLSEGRDRGRVLTRRIRVFLAHPLLTSTYCSILSLDEAEAAGRHGHISGQVTRVFETNVLKLSRTQEQRRRVRAKCIYLSQAELPVQIFSIVC